jgi:hypothetical protein
VVVAGVVGVVTAQPSSNSDSCCMRLLLKSLASFSLDEAAALNFDDRCGGRTPLTGKADDPGWQIEEANIISS